MKTVIQETELYKKFIKALNIDDMRADDNPFVVKCCQIAEELASQSRDTVSDELLNFILEIDFMTTSEFCKKFNVPEPVFTGEVQSSARQFLQIDAIKHRMFVEKAKAIQKGKIKPTIEGDMFMITEDGVEHIEGEKECNHPESSRQHNMDDEPDRCEDCGKLFK